MRDDRMNEQQRAMPAAGRRDEVISSGELRDSGAARGRVSEEYVVHPEPAVRRDAVVDHEVRRAPAHQDDVEIPEAYNLRRDRVR